MPEDEALVPSIEALIKEATRTVEEELKLEDAGWINLSNVTPDIITDAQRILNLKLSRLYSMKDPLGRQSIRLWTDYTFGPGMTWNTEDEAAKKALDGFWNAQNNQSVLSARGQRKSSDKLLIDGEVFFAIFLGPNGSAIIRRIDPLEIFEIITDPEDIDSVLFYHRKWTTRMGQPMENIYPSITNPKGESALNAAGQRIEKTDDALVYHLTYNTIGQRGNPLLLPALDWIKQYRRFLASRVAIMLALARFAWRSKVKGPQAAVDGIRDTVHDEEVAAGSWLVENLAMDTQPIKQETGSKGAYTDARMIKLQIAAAVGIPEQYYGDISIGNLATAKTVELPMMKMFQSYQKVWGDAFQDMDEVVLRHNEVPPDNWYVDRDFPAIAPHDVIAAATAIAQILTAFPDFAYLDDVKQVALMALGINDTAEVLDKLSQESKGNVEVLLTRALREFKYALQETNGRSQR